MRQLNRPVYFKPSAQTQRFVRFLNLLLLVQNEDSYLLGPGSLRNHPLTGQTGLACDRCSKTAGRDFGLFRLQPGID